MRIYPDAAEKFIADPTSGLSTESSRDSYRKAIRALALLHPQKELEEYTEDDLIAYVGREDLAPATRASYRTRLEGFFSWAQWRGLIDTNPAANLKRLVKGSFTRPVRQHNWLDADTVTRVLDTIDVSTVQGLRSMVIVRLGFTMGLRRQEIVKLRWRDVDLVRQQVSLVGKGNKLASTYITDSTLPWLEKWHGQATEGLGHEPRDEWVIPRLSVLTDFKSGWYTEVDWARGVTVGVISQTVSKISEEAGVRFAPHDMRRSFANMLEAKGASVEGISSALRHSDVGVTQRYLEKRQDASYQSVRRVGLDV